MYQYSQGDSTRQAHKGVPEGAFEEEQGLKGFFGRVSHLIKKRPSTRWKNIKGDLKPHLFDLLKVKKNYRQRLLYNTDVEIGLKWVPQEKPTLAERNANGDVVYFCHKGRGVVLTEYGALLYSAGSYIVIPKCLTHVIISEEESLFLSIENKSSHYEEPERGMVGKNAFYDANAICKPDLIFQNKYEKENQIDILEIEVRHGESTTLFSYDESIFDTMGWKGDLYPYTLHVDHLNPLMSHRVHLPPSAHSTFVAKEFVVCTFLPRPLEEDTDALKVPFYHQNIDYDEVLFYHAGDFFSRDNLHAGMMSLHPAGFPHGPHPKAVEAVKNKKRTDEYAVMVDSKKSLKMDDVLLKTEVKDYWKSWQ